MMTNDYLDWLIKTYGIPGYTKLLAHLHDVGFRYQMVLDENRAYAGLKLRDAYAFEAGVYQSDVADGPCSVLEMLIGLSIDLVYQTGLKTPEEFLDELLGNLALDDYSDRYFNEDEVNYILNRWLDRRYMPDGDGSVFGVVPGANMLTLDIWGQMTRYIDYHYPLDRDLFD
ncbi:hypothetical protein [Lachnoclostridium sp. Marseille-P6806]|uniref:hypothetical protein n=1 Tax=Lachnoclostridium sp. Marseille-P6806 TaxID=2364793 RepID=UPI00103241FF|nr:hypothetical protein [Lachnoclostridium sp. Marseille-P6806]